MAHRLKESFIFAFRDGLRELATDRRCIGQDYRVLLFLMSVLEWGNWLRVSQTDMAQELGISRHAVWKSIHRMKEYGILLQGPKLGHLPTYQLNEAIGYFG